MHDPSYGRGVIVHIRLFELYLCKYHAKHLILTKLCGGRIPLPGLSTYTSLVFTCNSFFSAEVRQVHSERQLRALLVNHRKHYCNDFCF